MPKTLCSIAVARQKFMQNLCFLALAGDTVEWLQVALVYVRQRVWFHVSSK